MNQKSDRNESKFIIDRCIHGITEYQFQIFGLFLLLIFSVLIRIHLAPFCDLSPDYNTYYKEWVNQYRNVGFWNGLGQTIGDYYVPMNILYGIASLFPFEPWVLISFFSCLFEYIGVYFLYKIAVFLGTGKVKAAYAAVLVLFIPCSIFDSALWKQCDSIYVCFAVISIYYLLKNKYNAALIFLGISLSFKLQAIFLLPLFVVVYLIKKNYSILSFLWLPIVYLVAGLPSVFAGRGIKATYLTYLLQTQEGTTESYGMNSFFPNIYALGLDNYYDELAIPAILITIVVLGLIILLVIRNKQLFDGKMLISTAIWMAWTCCMFLPGMHERYDYLILVLMVAAAFVIEKKYFVPMIVINFCSLITYTITLFKTETVPLEVVAVIYIGAYVLYSFYQVSYKLQLSPK